MVAIDHIAITVKDLDRAIDFYSSIFGFSILKVKEKIELGVRYAVLKAGQVNLELITPLKGEAMEQQLVGEGFEGIIAKLCGEAGLNHLSFHVDNLNETCEELKNKGVRSLARVTSSKRGSKQAFITDPEGNLIELIQRS